jgi:hypothetical protein
MMTLLSSIAIAGLPCEGTSTVMAVGSGACAPVPGAAICPNGDLDVITVTVTVLDCYGTPLSGKNVVIWAYSEETFCWCPDGEPTPYQLEDTKLVGPTNAAGVVAAQFKKFGGCGNIKFYATVDYDTPDEVVLGPSVWMRIASPDNNSDCLVNLADFGNFALMYPPNPYDECGDFNCDGAVNLADFGTFALHYTHHCSWPNP